MLTRFNTINVLTSCTICVYNIAMKNQKSEQLHVRISTHNKLSMAIEAEKLGLGLSAFILFIFRYYVGTKGSQNIKVEYLENLKEIPPKGSGFYIQEKPVTDEGP